MGMSLVCRSQSWDSLAPMLEPRIPMWNRACSIAVRQAISNLILYVVSFLLFSTLNFTNAFFMSKVKVKVKSLSRVRLFVTHGL